IAVIFNVIIIKEVYKVAKKRGCTVLPSVRRIHNGEVPFLGGIAIYISLLLSVSIFAVFFKDKLDSSFIIVVILCLSMLVFVGFKDDLDKVTPRKKLIAQLFVAIIALLLLRHLKIDFLNLFGVNELPVLVGYAFSIFIILTFINAFNFIDGVDGLCSSLALIAFVFFGIIAILENNFTQILFNFSFIGALIPSIFYNVFSKQKMFLGDNGSFLLGFFVGIQVVLILANYNNAVHIIDISTPVILMALLSYPLVDSGRVILVRIIRGVSPFSPDSNHIHHHLYRLGLTHLQITVLILLYTILITMAAILLRQLNINISFVLFFSVSVIVLNIPAFLLKRRNKLGTTTNSLVK
ncbi:undecaprenyl/decaprenyl-phosphate alpha-N-acetylglucosaminyl 1-phosphate transferase, partial [Flavobacteriaceae bacterium AH-315-B10]|nr:undecaprenyl/decaprenyl-phosphate alpha-N-acetylglucosaminyl 1-phosphate transferase [Flavobacteriaceae bacterium AH-315-B10]